MQANTFATCRFEHPATDRDDQTGLLGNRNEVIRRDRSPAGVVPAKQGLDADDLAAGEPHDGLIVEFELVQGHRVLQVRTKFQPLDDALVHRRLEHAVASLAVALCHIHRDVGIAQEIRRSGRLVLADETDPDTRPREDVLAFDLHRQVECTKNPCGRVGGVLRAVDAVEQHGELVAAEARDGVGRPDRALEPVADLS